MNKTDLLTELGNIASRLAVISAAGAYDGDLAGDMSIAIDAVNSDLMDLIENAAE